MTTLIDLTRYVATVNVPGYLPVSDEVYRFETPEDAWAFLANERDESLTDDGEELTHMWLRHLSGDAEYARPTIVDLGTCVMVDSGTLCGTVIGPTRNHPYGDRSHDLGLAYTVTEDNELLELADHAVRGYCETMLWCGAFDAETGEQLSEAHLDYAPVALSDFSADAQTEIESDVYSFIASNEDDFREFLLRTDEGLESNAASKFGHDFYLTRNGHGAGFWDRGLGDLGDRLTAMSKPYGDMSAYITDGEPIEVQS
jgi:hypothetical protein